MCCSKWHTTNLLCLIGSDHMCRDLLLALIMRSLCVCTSTLCHSAGDCWGRLLWMGAGESQHMAKASEGRNQAQDNPINHALHEALKPET